MKSDNKKSGIKKSPTNGRSQEQGLNPPSQSSVGDFSISEIPFTNDSSETIRHFLGSYLPEKPRDLWQTEGWSRTKEYNTFTSSPLSDEELRKVFDECVIGIDELLTEKQIDFKEKEIQDVFKKNKKKGTYLLAQYIVRKYDIITVGEKEREIFIYKDGIYFQAENEIIFPEIQRILGDEVDRNAKSETLHKIQDMTAKSRDIFCSTDVRYIPLSNGVYDFKEKKLLPHSPEYKFKYKFPIVYSEKADCLKTLAFFEQILTPDQIKTLQEWLGYYFYRSYMFKKAIIFVGEGDTGKTTLLEVITYLLGKQNISAISLQKMSSDKFSAAHLYEKHGNLVDELSAKDISDTGAFKMATGGGTITGEYKFGNQFGFYNFSKFTFACNRIPDVTDFDDTAYFNRWIVIRFENTIEKKIPNFISTLTIEDERSGLFNWAMEGLERLLKEGRFSYSSDADDTKMEMLRSSSSSGEFIAKRVEHKIGNEVTKEEMYDTYVEFCTQNKLSVASKKAFGMKFITLKYVSDGLIYGTSGKRVEGWKNVAIIPAEEKKVEDLNAEISFNEY